MFQSDDEWVDNIQYHVYEMMDECSEVDWNNIIEMCLVNFYRDGEVDYYKEKNPHLSDEEVQSSFRENIRYIMEDR